MIVSSVSERLQRITSNALTRLEPELLKEAKNTIAEDVPIERDARGMRIGIQIIETMFDILRRKIVTKNNDT